MKIDTVRPGQRFTLDGLDQKTGKPATIAFTVLSNDWFRSPSPDHPGAFYHGAKVLADDGRIAVLDFILIEFCQPLLCLPAPAR